MASTEELTREIGRARAELASTLEVVGDRVAPKKVVARTKADVAERLDNVRDRMSPARMVKRQTEGLGVRIRDVQESLMGENDVSRGKELQEEGRIQRVTGTVRGQSRRLAEQTGGVAGTVANRGQRAPAALRDKAGEHALVAGLVALGGGVLVASLLPPSGRERKVAQRVKENAQPLKDTALQAGQSVTDEVRQAAQDSTEQVKRRASDAAKQVKQQAKASTQRTKGQAKAAATQVKRQTKAASSQVKAEAKRPSTTTKAAKPGQSAPAKKTVASRR